MDVSYCMIYAVCEGREERVCELIRSCGLSYSRAWLGGYALLCDALKNKHRDVAGILLINGSKVNNPTTYPSDTPLHFAVINGDIEHVEMIIDRGGNINAQNQDGRTALHIAVQNNNIEITKLLLSYGSADVNLSDIYGRTALHFASEFGELSGLYMDEELSMLLMFPREYGIKGEIAELLLSKGANLHLKNEDGETPLHTAIQKGSPKVVEALLKYTADVNYCGVGEECDITPLHLSARNGYGEITMMLLNKGADVNGKQNDGTTALHIATREGHKEVVKVLLEYNAKVDSKTESDITPLHLSAKCNDEEISKMLLNKGADINCRDKYGRTPLHIASKLGCDKVIVTLLEYDSDINITTNENHTPLEDAYVAIDRCSYDRYLEEFIPESFLEVVDALELHILKMKTADLYVSEKNLLQAQMHWFNVEMNAFKMFVSKQKFEGEILSMKCEKISSNLNISFYDILTKGANSLAGYMRNKNVPQVLKSVDYKTKFPIYGRMIEINCRKGFERKELVEQGHEIFRTIFSNFSKLPYDCTEKILTYLSNGDLRILKDACKPLSIMRTLPTSTLWDIAY